MPEAGDNLVDNTKETINAVNLKTLGETNAVAHDILIQDVLQQRREQAASNLSDANAKNQIQNMFLGSLAKGMTEMDPVQAMGLKQGFTGDVTAERLLALLAGALGVKGFSGAPPESGS